MKTQKILFMAFVIAGMPFSVNAQTEEKAPLRADSVSVQLQIKQLEQQKSKLAKRIEAEDRKRNQTIAGVSVENMEIINIRQDSLCLALRSEMTDIDLAIAEHKEALHALSATPTTQTAVSSAQQANQPAGTPQKPTKVQQAINALNNRPTTNK